MIRSNSTLHISGDIREEAPVLSVDGHVLRRVRQFRLTNDRGSMAAIVEVAPDKPSDPTPLAVVFDHVAFIPSDQVPTGLPRPAILDTWDAAIGQ